MGAGYKPERDEVAGDFEFADEKWIGEQVKKRAAFDSLAYSFLTGVCQVEGLVVFWHEVQRNVRLIAAAPELLALVETAMLSGVMSSDWMDAACHVRDTINGIGVDRAALAKPEAGA